MIVNNLLQPAFNFSNREFDCSLPSIYTYFQSDQALQNNTPTNIVIISDDIVTVTLKTKYNNISPSLIGGNCLPPLCIAQVVNNCVVPIHYLNYFDIFELTFNFGGTSVTTSYYVYCKIDYSSNTL